MSAIQELSGQSDAVMLVDKYPTPWIVSYRLKRNGGDWIAVIEAGNGEIVARSMQPSALAEYIVAAVNALQRAEKAEAALAAAPLDALRVAVDLAQVTLLHRTDRGAGADAAAVAAAARWLAERGEAN